jgi:hypothetical protein
MSCKICSTGDMSHGDIAVNPENSEIAFKKFIYALLNLQINIIKACRHMPKQET